MELEDHVGDIIAKARKGLGINPSQAAEAANLNLINYSQLEEDGNIEPATNIIELCKLLGLTSKKLSLIASGWSPILNLSKYKNIQQISTTESMEVHCYLAWDEETLEAAAREFASANDIGLGKLAQPLRSALTGSNASPGIFEVLQILGKEEALARLSAVPKTSF